MPLADLPEISVQNIPDEDKETLPDLPDLMPSEMAEVKEDIKEFPAPAEVEKARPRIQPLLKPEKQKPRWLSITFLSILLAGAAFLLFLWFTRTPAAQEPVVSRPAAARTALKKQPAKQSEADVQESKSPAAGNDSAREEIQPTGSELQKPKPAPEKTVPLESKIAARSSRGFCPGPAAVRGRKFQCRRRHLARRDGRHPGQVQYPAGNGLP